MPNFSAASIVNEFLRRRASIQWPAQMFVQKLAYISHGWNLAINNEALISERAEAWDNGPVYRSVWNLIRDYGYRGTNCTLVDPASGEEYVATLSQSERAVVDHVWNKYRHNTATDLSNLTHQAGTPWFNAYFNAGRNASLNDEEIQRHYVQLAVAGREQRQAAN
jgi:uncharacterized phage-associated protein